MSGPPGDADLLDRCRARNTLPPPESARCVLYLMSRDQRTEDNHALLAAQRHALAGALPLVVAFVLYPGTARSTARRAREHFAFLLDGLDDVASGLAEAGVSFVVRIAADSPLNTITALVAECGPAAVYVDFSPLRGPRALCTRLAASVPVPVFEVDTHNVVPAWIVSDKQEFAARTIRPKIHRLLSRFLVSPPALSPHPFAWTGSLDSVPLDVARRVVLPGLRGNGTIVSAVPGQVFARRALADFVARRLAGYAEDRDDPTADGLSGLSPYLHFGQLSALRVALTVGRSPGEGADALIEEMLVRKELSDNFCLHNPRYDSLAGAPGWALRTLTAHEADPRPYLYTFDRLEHAETDDEAWNAAQREMTRTGKMHGYMRMYWAKKILEWTPSPSVALDFAIRLNDFYSIDGGDPNGYVGILWSIAGVHDRPWVERDVFGQIRYMNFNGLKRKFRIEAYIARFPE